MDVSLDQRWERLVDRLVDEGRFGSRSDVVSEGLRLIEEREAKLAALREMLDASIAQGGEVTDEEFEAELEERRTELSASGGLKACNVRERQTFLLGN